MAGGGKPPWYTVKSPLWMEPKSGVWAQTWSVAQQYFYLALVSFIFSFSATTIWISLITFIPSVTHSLLSLNYLTSDLRENRAFQHSPSPCLETHSQTKKYIFILHFASCLRKWGIFFTVFLFRSLLNFSENWSIINPFIFSFSSTESSQALKILYSLFILKVVFGSVDCSSSLLSSS